MTTSYPTSGMFGGRLNAYLQGRRAKVKHAEVVLAGYSNEIQTIDLNDIGAADTFKLTHNAVASAQITFAADMSTAIQTALEALASIGTGNVTVAKGAGQTYACTFVGALAHTDVSAITITNSAGFTPGVVTETNKGQTGLTTVTGILKDDIVLFVYDVNDNDDLTVVDVQPGTIEIDGDADDGHTAVVAWLTRH